MKVISVNKVQQKEFAEECRKKLVEKATPAEITYQQYLKKKQDQIPVPEDYMEQRRFFLYSGLLYTSF